MMEPVHSESWHALGFVLLRRAVLMVLLCVCVSTIPPAVAQINGTAAEVPLIRTDGPGETVTSFAELRAALEGAVRSYLDAPSRAGVLRIDLILANLRGLIDLDELPAANRQRLGNATVLALLDTFGRVGLPDPTQLPAADSFDDVEGAAVRLPGIPLRIARIKDGPRVGEWLFGAASVTVAPRFLAGIIDKPLASGLGWDSWTTALPQLTGPRVPVAVASSIPKRLQVIWLGLPLWKTALLVIAAGITWFVLARVNRRTARAVATRGPRAAPLGVLTPALALVALQILLPSFSRQLMPFSQMPDAIASAITLLSFASLAWLFWSGVQALVRMRIAARERAEGPFDRDFLRLIGAGLGGLGVMVIAVTGAQRLGIPVLSLAAGLGIGGLAVALAVRPTLENLVGGLLLYIDRPVRIGDFCTFGAHSGTIERIGVQAVWVRALDRTLISIPNARFADMELVNWAACDMMLIQKVLRLRLETSTDQLRFVLAEIRKMLHAHPRIEDDTIRIRYLGPGESAREVDLRFYARTREWNEFFAIREDAFLRIDEIVEAAGAKTAVPARVLHLARDGGGTDPERRGASEDRVAAWRRAGTLPFPKFSADELATLDNTLDYPPSGSPDAGTEGPYRAATPEKLSQEPHTDASDKSGTTR